MENTPKERETGLCPGEYAGWRREHCTEGPGVNIQLCFATPTRLFTSLVSTDHAGVTCPHDQHEATHNRQNCILRWESGLLTAPSGSNPTQSTAQAGSSVMSKSKTRKHKIVTATVVVSVTCGFCLYCFQRLSDLAGKMGTISLYRLLGCKMTQWLPLGCATEQTLCIHMSWFVFLTLYTP